MGRVLADRKATRGPLRLREVGYLSVAPDTLTLYRATKRVLLGGFRATDDVVVSAPRASVTGAWQDKGTLGGTFEVTFDDGTTWAFDVPRARHNGIDAAVAAIAPATGT